MTKANQVCQFINSTGILDTSIISQSTGVSCRHVRRIKQMYINTKQSATQIVPRAPAILMLDIETAPLNVLTWGIYKQIIQPHNIVKDWSILGWCGKYLGQSNTEIFGDRVTGDDARAGIDDSVMVSLHNALTQADIVVAHNGKAFDIPRINTRFIANGFPIPTPYKVIDTKEVAKKCFSFTSNSLDELAKFFGLARKASAPYKWWRDAVVDGDDESVAKIFNYCQQDIVVLEQVYLTLLPWMPAHPNVSLYVDAEQMMCPLCGNINLLEYGRYTTTVGVYQAYKCNNCGGVSRSRFTSVPKERRKNIIVPIAR